MSRRRYRSGLSDMRWPLSLWSSLRHRVRRLVVELGDSRMTVETSGGAP